MAVSWTLSIGKQDDAIALLKQGMQANPVSSVHPDLRATSAAHAFAGTC